MRMSIAEPIQTLEYLRDSGVFPFSTTEGVLYTAGSIDLAIEIMRKYQRIQEIAKAHKNGATGLACMNEICEVIEDGKKVKLRNDTD